MGEGFEEDWRGGGSRNVIKSWGHDVSLKYYLLPQVTLFYPVGTKLISEWKEMRERIEFNDMYTKDFSILIKCLFKQKSI